MKKIIFLLLLIFHSLNSLSNNPFDPLEQAKKVAIGTDKLILIDFYADWCGPCKKMDAESWSNDEIKKITENFVFVKIDIDNYKEIAKKYAVNGIPYVFILDATGEIVYNHIGYLSKSQLKNTLNTYSLNMNYLQSSYLINFEKETTFSNTRIAQKYQEYSILLDDKLKKKFLLLSKKYLDKSRKSLKQNENKYIQKIELLYLQGYVLNGDYKKVFKKLESNFKEEEIQNSNKSLYCFLNYMVYENGGNDEVAQKWLDHLVAQKGNKIYLTQIKLINSKS